MTLYLSFAAVFIPYFDGDFLQNQIMSKISFTERATCQVLNSPIGELSQWLEIFEKRYEDHLNRQDGFSVTKKSPEGNKTVFLIYDFIKTSKKPVLTISLFNKTGTVMIQGLAHQTWKETESETLCKIKEMKAEIDENLSSFTEKLRSLSNKKVNGNVDFPNEIIDLPLPDEHETGTEDPLNDDEPTLNQKLLLSEINDLKSAMKKLTNKLVKIESENKTFVESLVTEKTNLEKEIASLKKQQLEYKKAQIKQQQDYEDLKMQLLHFIENFKDEKVCLKTGDRIQQKELCDIKSELEAMRKDTEQVKTNFEALRNRTNDKIKNFNQHMNAYDTIIEDINKAQKTMKREIEKSTTNDKNTSVSQPEADTSTRHAPHANSEDSMPGQGSSEDKPIYLGNKEHLVIGDSIIKGIKSATFDRSRRSFIKTIRGGRIEDIQAKINSLQAKNLRSIVIHVGTNDLSSSSAETIAQKLTALAGLTKARFPDAKLFLSSIIPREDREGTKVFTEKINLINARVTDQGKNVGFETINHSNVHDASLRYDGLHLADRGTALLVKNIKASLKLRPGNHMSLPQDHSGRFRQTGRTRPSNVPEDGTLMEEQPSRRPVERSARMMQEGPFYTPPGDLQHERLSNGRNFVPTAPLRMPFYLPYPSHSIPINFPNQQPHLYPNLGQF